MRMRRCANNEKADDQIIIGFFSFFFLTAVISA